MDPAATPTTATANDPPDGGDAAGWVILSVVIGIAVTLAIVAVLVHYLRRDAKLPHDGESRSIWKRRHNHAVSGDAIEPLLISGGNAHKSFWKEGLSEEYIIEEFNPKKRSSSQMYQQLTNDSDESIAATAKSYLGSFLPYQWMQSVHSTPKKPSLPSPPPTPSSSPGRVTPVHRSRNRVKPHDVSPYYPNLQALIEQAQFFITPNETPRTTPSTHETPRTVAIEGAAHHGTSAPPIPLDDLTRAPQDRLSATPDSDDVALAPSKLATNTPPPEDVTRDPEAIPMPPGLETSRPSVTLSADSAHSNSPIPDTDDPFRTPDTTHSPSPLPQIPTPTSQPAPRTTTTVRPLPPKPIMTENIRPLPPAPTGTTSSPSSTTLLTNAFQSPVGCPDSASSLATITPFRYPSVTPSIATGSSGTASQSSSNPKPSPPLPTPPSFQAPFAHARPLSVLAVFTAASVSSPTTTASRMHAISESPCHSVILEYDEPDSAVTECPSEVFSPQDDSNLEAHLRWSDGAHVPHVSGPGPLPGPSNSTDGSGSRPMYFTPDELESDDVPSEALRIPLPPGTGSTIDGHRDGTNSTPHIPLQHSELPPSTPAPTTPRPMTPRTFTTNRDSHPRTPSDMTVTDFSDTGVSDMGHSVLSEEVGGDRDSHDDGDCDGASSIADSREEGASLLKPHLPSLRISPFELEFDDDASAIRG